MNSKQRRQIERRYKLYLSRRYKHSITLTVRDERYHIFDERTEEARKWCKSKFEKDTWIRKADWDHSIFYFAKESDAVYFGLTWL